jgi:hypothetical protein
MNRLDQVSLGDRPARAADRQHGFEFSFREPDQLPLVGGLFALALV